MSNLPANYHPTVIVIGGGATGAGIARDASQRGFRVIVIEMGEMASGTTGHFHGILHSGSRYAVQDPATAAECYNENQILRRMIPSAITDTGGLFLAMNDEEASYANTLIEACIKAGIPAEEISIDDVRSGEPHVAPTLKRAFTVPDAFIYGGRMVGLNQYAAGHADTPATFLTHHEVVGMQKSGGRVTSVRVRDTRTGESYDIGCDYVVNATGVWAGRTASLAGVILEMIYDKGSMIAYKDNFSSAVLNRCRPQDDGDLLVPSGGFSVLGTTARVITDIDQGWPTQEEIDVLIREGSEMIPALQGAEVSKIYAGIRPLQGSPALQSTENTRGISRSYHVIDHADDGVNNFISVVGGKVTVYRLMAETTVNLLCSKSGNSATCQTAITPLQNT